VDKRGGIDLTQPLTLTFDVTYNGKPIRNHIMDQKLHKYTADDGGSCHWKEIDTGGVTDDMDACQFITSPECSYASKPKRVVSVIDWQKAWGEGALQLEQGAYYAFESTERDGSEFLNCFWIQSKILKS